MNTDKQRFGNRCLFVSSRLQVSALNIILFLFSALCSHAAEKFPPKPEHYFNDYAHKISSATASRLDAQLQEFERKTSSQIIVAIFPRMESDSSLEDFAQRIYQAWAIGQKKTNNGALLLVFLAEHKMRIQTGYGLEGALPDALCKRIIEDEIAPRFRQNNFDGGITAGVNAILAATQGEYKGSGRTVGERGGGNSPLEPYFMLLPFIFFIIVVVILRSFAGRGIMYGRRGSTYVGGWGGSSSGWSSGGGGGFSGGGGSSGGGGASGGW